VRQVQGMTPSDSAYGISSRTRAGGRRQPHAVPRRARQQTALELLQRDHENIQSEFEGFQTAGGDDRYFLANRVLRELELHARLEADVFYPAVQAHVDRQANRKSSTAMRTAWKGHQAIQAHLAKVKDSRTHDEAFIAQIDGLMQDVQRHMAMEEREVFPLVQALLGETALARLQRNIETRRDELDHELAA